jgi:tellurite methyltransferase
LGSFDHKNIPEPSQFLVENLDLLPRGSVLDLAMGSGRNAVFLARHGFHVEGVDVSADSVRQAQELAIKAAVVIKAGVADLEGGYSIKKAAYDVIICFNYLQRSLMGQIKDGIKTMGVICYETYIIDQLQFGKPRNPQHLLEHNELLQVFKDFRCLRYREGIIQGARGKKAVASIIAQKVPQGRV